MQQCLVCEGEAQYKELDASRYFCGVECQAMHHQLIGIFGDEYEMGYAGLQKYNLMYFDPTTLANMAFTSRRVRALIDPIFLEEYTNAKGAKLVFEALNDAMYRGDTRVVRFWIDHVMRIGWHISRQMMSTVIRKNYNDIVRIAGPYYTEVTLDLSDSELTLLPEDIGRVSALSALFLFRNNLTEIPESIGDLVNLRCLHLAANLLIRLPQSIGDLSNLTSLFLARNQLIELPESIGQLSHLQSLTLQQNQLERLPETFGNLPMLSSLDLRDNKLTDLPRSFRKLKMITTLGLSGNTASVSHLSSQANWISYAKIY